jgi:hypothetical protein
MALNEEIGLDITFEETRIRGTKKYQCIMRATELGNNGGHVDEILIDKSWKSFKQKYPTLKDILIDIFDTDSWSARWRGGERTLYIESISGHEGLYDFDENQRVEVDWDTEVAIKR